MVRRAKSLWHTRQWCGRWRTCRTRRCSGSPCVSMPAGRHTIPPAVDGPGRNWRGRPDAGSGRRVAAAHRGWA